MRFVDPETERSFLRHFHAQRASKDRVFAFTQVSCAGGPPAATHPSQAPACWRR
jgi:hypothetical protein